MIKLQKAVEHYDRPGRAQDRVALFVRGINRNLFELRLVHLAGDCALPDQFVKASLVFGQVTADILRRPRRVGRTDRFMRFLGVLGTGPVGIGRSRHVIRAELATDQRTASGDGFLRHLDAVRPHIGDQPDGFSADIDAFVKPLCRPHRPAG